MFVRVALAVKLGLIVVAVKAAKAAVEEALEGILDATRPDSDAGRAVSREELEAIGHRVADAVREAVVEAMVDHLRANPVRAKVDPDPTPARVHAAAGLRPARSKAPAMEPQSRKKK